MPAWCLKQTLCAPRLSLAVVVFPWCHLEIRRGFPGLSRVEKIVPGSSYSCIIVGREQGEVSQDTNNLFPWTWPPAFCPV